MKRDIDSSSDSDDDYIGPSLVQDEPKLDSVPEKTSVERSTDEPSQVKKRRISPQWIETIPSGDLFLLEEEQDSTITVLSNFCGNSLVIGGFKNGTVKFWHKNKDKLELIKSYAAHPGKAVQHIQITAGGSLAVSIAASDSTANIYDLHTFDMIQSVKLELPEKVCWFGPLSRRQLMITTTLDTLLAYDLENDITSTIQSMHRMTIQNLTFNDKYKCFLSADVNGMLEVWNEEGNFPALLGFQYKSQSDLFIIRKSKSTIKQLALSPNGEYFATISLPDEKLRIFDFKSCKVTLESSWMPPALKVADYVPTMLFNSDSSILAYTSAHGLEFMSLVDGSVLRVLGEKDQRERNLLFDKFIWCSDLDMSGLSAEMLTSNNALLDQKFAKRPLVVSSAFNSSKLYVYNLTQADRKVTKSQVENLVTLHTTKGDIKLQLFAEQTPKTVKNFIQLCKSKYYNQVIFHRVIRNFMIQTGDPLGDGTGGDSSFGGDFEDEFNDSLNHSQPYMLSMANAGPNTNRSQFFITTAAAPWLDNKHTVFGKVTEGVDVVKAIAAVPTDKSDRPKSQVAIVSITVINK